jgi:hypothetical protein
MHSAQHQKLNIKLSFYKNQDFFILHWGALKQKKTLNFNNVYSRFGFLTSLTFATKALIIQFQLGKIKRELKKCGESVV